MKKTLNSLEYEKYAYDVEGEHVIRISNTLSSLTLIGNKSGISNDMQNQLTEIVNVGSKVQKLGDYCCISCNNLTSVNVSENLKSFGDYCFADCNKLNELNIFKENPQFVYGIGDHAFENTNIEKVNLDLRGRNYTTPDDYEGCVVTTLEDGPYAGDYAFANCKKLKSVKLLTSTELGSHMFDGCSELTSVEFANHGSCVGDYAFANCSQLPSITFPQKFELISQHMFENCVNLTAVNIPDNATKFTNIENNCFSNTPKLTSITLPENSITTPDNIDDNAFVGSSLKQITLNGVLSNDLIQYSGRKTFKYLDFSPNSTEKTNFKYGTWYGTDINSQYAKNFAIKNDIPLVYIACSKGCSLCSTLQMNVLSNADVCKWVAKSPYIFVYSYENPQWMWDILRELKYSKSSVGIPLFIAVYKDNKKYRVRGCSSSNFNDTLIKWYDDFFKGYERDDTYENGNVINVEKTKVFSGWGLDHNCDIYSKEHEKFTWYADTKTLKYIEHA